MFRTLDVLDMSALINRIVFVKCDFSHEAGNESRKFKFLKKKNLIVLCSNVLIAQYYFQQCKYTTACTVNIIRDLTDSRELTICYVLAVCTVSLTAFLLN